MGLLLLQTKVRRRRRNRQKRQKLQTKVRRRRRNRQKRQMANKRPRIKEKRLSSDNPSKKVATKKSKKNEETQVEVHSRAQQESMEEELSVGSDVEIEDEFGLKEQFVSFGYYGHDDDHVGIESLSELTQHVSTTEDLTFKLPWITFKKLSEVSKRPNKKAKDCVVGDVASMIREGSIDVIKSLLGWKRDHFKEGDAASEEIWNFACSQLTDLFDDTQTVADLEAGGKRHFEKSGRPWIRKHVRALPGH
ncbi:expressed unknown protein [Seminavis robusta]|uniref:Uncharacterized protein n=1 Tax=Seminavis robusta TaxID=568900 RepID=A0A9N8EDZ8_9STRA|nr:expressed unknown protein [Seminavis robusta]|eukprot:Sro863_g212541.1  (249) ;mRNA; r:26754-27909